MITSKIRTTLAFLIIVTATYAPLTRCIVSQKTSVKDYSQILDQPIMEVFGYGTLGVIFGTGLFIKGIFDAMDIPLTYVDNCALAKRTKMFKDDLERHHLGRQIKSGIEIVSGALTIISSACLLGLVACAVYQKMQAQISS